MTELETIGMCILIVVYGCVFYMAGRANLLDLVMAMMQNAIKELEEKPKDKDESICIPVIRCKNCKWFGKVGCAINIVDDTDKPTENDFCSFAELKEEQEVK